MPRFKTAKPLSLEELYEAIKDVPFEAGTPDFFRHGGIFYDIILIQPPVGLMSQICITGSKGKFTVGVMKAHTKGYSKAATDRFAGEDPYITKGWNIKYGTRMKAAEVLAKDVAETIAKLKI